MTILIDAEDVRNRSDEAELLTDSILQGLDDSTAG